MESQRYGNGMHRNLLGEKRKPSHASNVPSGGDAINCLNLLNISWHLTLFCGCLLENGMLHFTAR